MDFVSREVRASRGGLCERDPFRDIEVELGGTGARDLGVCVQQGRDACRVCQDLHVVVDRDGTLEGHLDLRTEALPDHPDRVAAVPGMGRPTEAACDAGSVAGGFVFEGVCGV
jgi:hypothetical protein